MNEKLTVLISEEEIQKRIDELAKEINKDFSGKDFIMICVLKGAVIFMVDLAKKLDVGVEFDFIDISSYGNATESSGVIKILKDLDHPVTGKDVLVIEDIIDTGRTLSHLVKHLKAQNPNSVKVCTLLDKPDRRVAHDVIPDYVAFHVPDKFVVGYGLDYYNRYRNLPYVGTLSFDED